MQADGHHYAGRGRKGHVSIEIKADDVNVLRAMQKVIPWSTSITFRTRTANFAQHAESAILSMCALEGRMRLLELGRPTGRKSAVIAPPAEPFSHRDYLRSLWDADGSVGFTASGIPFLSLVTASPAIAEFVCAEILHVTGVQRTCRPNRRDGVSNIMVATDAAAVFARWLYGHASIALARKHIAAILVAEWKRPKGMRARSVQKRWTPEEDAIVMQVTEEEAVERLARTVLSVRMRRWRRRQIQRSLQLTGTSPERFGARAVPA